MVETNMRVKLGVLRASDCGLDFNLVGQHDVPSHRETFVAKIGQHETLQLPSQRVGRTEREKVQKSMSCTQKTHIISALSQLAMLTHGKCAAKCRAPVSTKC